jgi:hypothetical protein
MKSLIAETDVEFDFNLKLMVNTLSLKNGDSQKVSVISPIPLGHCSYIQDI